MEFFMAEFTKPADIGKTTDDRRQHFEMQVAFLDKLRGPWFHLLSSFPYLCLPVKLAKNGE